MERNHIIGFLLLFSTLFVWSYLNKPSEEQMAKHQQRVDSIQAAQIATDSIDRTKAIELAAASNLAEQSLPDSARVANNASVFGPMAPSSVGTAKEYTLQNDKIELTFSSKGGKIVAAKLKDYVKKNYTRGEETTEEAVVLLNDKRNKFEYLLPIASAPSGAVSTEDLYFEGTQSGNKITFTAKSNTGGGFVQEYTLNEGYGIDYKIDYSSISNVLDRKETSIGLNWQNNLHAYERNEQFEQQYSAVYYKEHDESDPDDCGCMQDDEEDLSDEKIDWVSHSNQYFNSAVIAKGTPFLAGKVASVKAELPEDKNKRSESIEKLSTTLDIPVEAGSFDMQVYVGPNDYNTLSAFDNSLEYIIPFGNSIFGTINRYVIRPVFDFLSRFIGSRGLIIILVIFVIKMLLYPLMYKMLHSQALMGALKPELAHLNEKFKNEPQKKQVETMKIYREYGVSPMGGCLPMIIQMPIWYALFRFFPASIGFRQESFLWAQDLSSYDDFFHLPFNIPFVGDHLSLFTILYSISMLVYTYYNTRHMDMSANPAMKYMQYLMPVMFFGFFNSYAAGLTCYMFFSNLINIAQTVITKQFIFKDEKLQAELKAKKAKPKKVNKFQQRMEEAMKQQQAMQAQKKKK